jgi:hypothetical protein
MTMKLKKLKLTNPDAAQDLLEACQLLYASWEQLLPNLKNGVVQDYELVCTTAPVKAKAAIAKATEEETRRC